MLVSPCSWFAPIPSLLGTFCRISRQIFSISQCTVKYKRRQVFSERAYKSGRKELFSRFCFLNKQMFHHSLPVNLRAGMLILIAVFGNSHVEPTHKALTGPFRIVKTVWKDCLCKNDCILYFSLMACLTQNNSSFTIYLWSNCVIESLFSYLGQFQISNVQLLQFDFHR